VVASPRYRSGFHTDSAVRFTDSGIISEPDPTDESVGYVRLKARVVGEVKVLFRQTLSGL